LPALLGGVFFAWAERAMKDMQVHLEKLRTDAAECQLICDLHFGQTLPASKRC